MLIIVRQIWFEELRSGRKRVEYRRYGPRFNERVFWPGHSIAFAYRRDRVSPRLHGAGDVVRDAAAGGDAGDARHLSRHGGRCAHRRDRRRAQLLECPMKFSDALAQDMPVLIGETFARSTPIAWAWELRKGVLAWVNGGAAMSPSAEAHVVEGTIEGEGPWFLTSTDGELRLEINPAFAHVAERGDRTDALNYLGFWYDNLRKAALVL
jgi:hypothetical protein